MKMRFFYIIFYSYYILCLYAATAQNENTYLNAQNLNPKFISAELKNFESAAENIRAELHDLISNLGENDEHTNRLKRLSIESMLTSLRESAKLEKDLFQNIKDNKLKDRHSLQNDLLPQIKLKTGSNISGISCNELKVPNVNSNQLSNCKNLSKNKKEISDIFFAQNNFQTDSTKIDSMKTDKEVSSKVPNNNKAHPENILRRYPHQNVSKTSVLSEHIDNSIVKSLNSANIDFDKNKKLLQSTRAVYSPYEKYKSNNLSHEANYKLSKIEQEEENSNSRYPLFFNKGKRKFSFNPMDEIKLKTSNRLMNLGMGSLLPSYSLSDSLKEDVLDKMIKSLEQQINFTNDNAEQISSIPIQSTGHNPKSNINNNIPQLDMMDKENTYSEKIPFKTNAKNIPSSNTDLSVETIGGLRDKKSKERVQFSDHENFDKFLPYRKVNEEIYFKNGEVPLNINKHHAFAGDPSFSAVQNIPLSEKPLLLKPFQDDTDFTDKEHHIKRKRSLETNNNRLVDFRKLTNDFADPNCISNIEKRRFKRKIKQEVTTKSMIDSMMHNNRRYTLTAEKSGGTTGEMLTRKLSFEIIKSILDRISSDPELKGLCPAATRFKPQENYKSFHSQNGKKVNDDDLEITDENIDGAQILKQSSIPLRPDLSQFYELIWKTYSEIENISSQIQNFNPPLLKTVDFKHADAKYIATKANAVKQLLHQFNKLTEENKEKVLEIRDKLLKDLAFLHEIEKQKQQETEVLSLQPIPKQISKKELLILENKNGWSSAFLNLLRTSELFRRADLGEH